MSGGRALASLSLLALALLAGGCVTRIDAKPGLGSFAVEVTALPPFYNASACVPPSELGSRECARPFSELGVPVAARLHLRALDRGGALARSYAGTAAVDVRPGMVTGVGPAGLVATFVNGEAELDLTFAQAFGATRIWIEDCGGAGAPGSFATGISAPIWFDMPRIDQIQITLDNTTSPLVPRATNICAIGGDPRWGLGVDRGTTALIGYARGKIDPRAGPPPLGSYLEVEGCGRDEYAKGQGCARGPLVVTAVAADGFYVTDVHARAMVRGFNSIFVATTGYPGELVPGDVVTSLRGSPTDVAGMTELANAVWTRDDSSSAAVRLMPAPIRLDAKTYEGGLRVEKCSGRQFGDNNASVLTTERLEGALVCMDRLAPASKDGLVVCDKNGAGAIERRACMMSCNDALPPLCSEGKTALAPLGEGCERVATCLALSADELATCSLTGVMPGNAPEYCCERACLNDPACTDANAFATDGHWAAEVFGAYELDTYPAVKINVVSRDARPDFDALQFGREQRALPKEQRQTLKVVGNLRHVLGARPVWVLMVRSPSDLEIGGTCP